MFYHTALVNSPFCQSVISSSLRMVNWQKNNRTCRCKKLPIDWCGCSPIYYKNSNEYLRRFKSLTNKPIFFARKFDPIFNQEIVNFLDEPGVNATSRNSFWINFFESAVQRKTELKIKDQILIQLLENKSDVNFNKLGNINEKRLISIESFFHRNYFKGFYF